MKNSKIKIAFVKFGGLAAGGTEKYLQTLAANLPKDRFEVDYYYTDGAPLLGNSWIHPDTDPAREKYMNEHDINLIHVGCESRQDTYGPPYPWVNDNFFTLFDSAKYDIVQTGRSGYAEYPFTKMSDCAFVDSIHGGGDAGIEKRPNILKTVLLSEGHAKRWISNGGDPSKVEVIPTLVEFPSTKASTLRKELEIPANKFLYGMHQRNDEEIFSSIPLEAYSLIESEKNMFVMLGGAQKYRQQAASLGLKNVRFLDFSGDVERINNFVSGLDVFAHGRHDGEVCSAAIIEALHYGKPVVSCPGINMGHAEQIEGCGIMTTSITEYAMALQRLATDDIFYQKKISQSIERYETRYSLDVAIHKYIQIYENICDRNLR